MKYVDSEKLIAEIEFAKSVYDNPKRVIHGVADAFRQDGRAAMCDDILKKIASLQQEQTPTEREIAEAHRYAEMIRERDKARIQPEQLAQIVAFVIENYRPSLPSNLDEAAEEYAYNNWEDNDYHTGASEGLPFDAIGHTEKCFRAGVEWMAGQGVTVECGVRVYPTLDGVAHRWVSLYKNGINIDSLKDIPRLKSLDFKDDDKAIVQIRKK